MNELKSCPFCGGESGYINPTGCWIICPDCGLTATFVEHQTTPETVELWNHRAQQQSNEPLTLEELRSMDGEPVWIELTDCPTGGHWEIWNQRHNSLDYYGEYVGWLAYRQKRGAGMSKCGKCPVPQCDAEYRGSRCASSRAAFGLGEPSTIFDYITTSPEALAPHLIRYDEWDITDAPFVAADGENYSTEEAAIEATVQWLNRPFDEEQK